MSNKRFVDLADVVKERDALDGALLRLVEPGRVGDDERAGRDAADVHPRLRVVRLDGVEQRLERRRGEALEALLAVALPCDDGAAG